MACPHGATSPKWCTQCINEEREAREAAERAAEEALRQEQEKAQPIQPWKAEPANNANEHDGYISSSGGNYPKGYLKAAQSWDMALATVSRISVMKEDDINRLSSSPMTTQFDHVDQMFTAPGLYVVTEEATMRDVFTADEFRFYCDSREFSDDMQNFYLKLKAGGVQYRARHVNDPSFPCTMCGKKRHSNDKKPFSAIATVPFDLLNVNDFDLDTFNKEIGEGKRKWVCDSCARYLLLPLAYGSEEQFRSANYVRLHDPLRNVNCCVNGPEKLLHCWSVASQRLKTLMPNYPAPKLVVER